LQHHVKLVECLKWTIEIKCNLFFVTLQTLQ